MTVLVLGFFEIHRIVKINLSAESRFFFFFFPIIVQLLRELKEKKRICTNTIRYENIKLYKKMLHEIEIR